MALDGVTLINNGVTDASSANMYTTNNGLLINNANMTIDSYSFATETPDNGDDVECAFTNNKYLIVNGGCAGYVINYGMCCVSSSIMVCVVFRHQLWYVLCYVINYGMCVTSSTNGMCCMTSFDALSHLFYS